VAHCTLPMRLPRCNMCFVPAVVFLSVSMPALGSPPVALMLCCTCHSCCLRASPPLFATSATAFLLTGCNILCAMVPSSLVTQPSASGYRNPQSGVPLGTDVTAPLLMFRSGMMVVFSDYPPSWNTAPFFTCKCTCIWLGRTYRLVTLAFSTTSGSVTRLACFKCGCTATAPLTTLFTFYTHSFMANTHPALPMQRFRHL
jgi:hypothetical protein